MSNQILVIENLSRTFNAGRHKIHALKKTDIAINKGEFVAIMGPSGSGKTTLLNIIGCLDKPSSGRVLIDNVDITKLTEDELSKIRRDKIGFIFQSANLMPILNAIENVQLPMECKKIFKEDSIKRTMTLLKLVGLVLHENGYLNLLEYFSQNSLIHFLFTVKMSSLKVIFLMLCFP